MIRPFLCAALLVACGGKTPPRAAEPAPPPALPPDASLAPVSVLEQRLARVVLVYEEMARIAEDNEDDCARMAELLVAHLRKHRADLDAVTEVEVTEEEMERIAAMFSARVEDAMRRLHRPMTKCPDVGPLIEREGGT